MTRQQSSSEQVQLAREVAMQKARLWADKAEQATQQGRLSHARRCEDKARDWVSRARQLERQVDPNT
jgi:hypothetical protein